jgi:ribonuclease H2 subunit A
MLVKTNEPVFSGAEEVGRDPGPIVYACAFAPLSKKDEVVKIGFKDSKLLTELQREFLFDAINKCEWIGFEFDIIHPQTISAKMLKAIKISLNVISNQSAAGIIRHILEKGFNIAELYVDTLGTPKVYHDYLARNFPQIGKIDVRSKADVIFPIVSAASIVAKVTRDHHLKDWKFFEKDVKNVDRMGSGYPSHEHTLSFLEENFDPLFLEPSIVRFSWKTITNLAKKKKAIDVKWFLDYLFIYIFFFFLKGRRRRRYSRN